MENPVDVAYLEQGWRPLSDSEKTNAEQLLAEAWDKALSRYPRLPEWVERNKVTTQTVKRVIAAAVRRVLKNPDGWYRESLDDWSGTRDQTTSTGELLFTDEELADLRPVSSVGSASVYNLGLGG